MTEAVVTVVGVEAENTGAPEASVTTVAAEAITTGAPEAVVSAVAAEAVNTGAPEAAISAVTVEAVNTGAPEAVVTQIVVEAVNTGAPEAAVTLVGIEVWRTLDDAPPELHFPCRYFDAPLVSARLPGGGLHGGVALSGEEQIEAMGPGGRWVFDFGEAALWTRERMNVWRAFAAAADLGARLIVVPMWDRLHGAYDPVRYDGDEPLGLELWDDPIRWRPEVIDAVVTVSAPKYATRISFGYANTPRPEPGIHFSIRGRRTGWRLHRIIRVVSDEGGVVTADIRPPLREWLSSGEELNFDSPRCFMRLDGEADAVLELLRFGRGSARFVESFGKSPWR